MSNVTILTIQLKAVGTSGIAIANMELSLAQLYVVFISCYPRHSVNCFAHNMASRTPILTGFINSGSNISLKAF